MWTSLGATVAYYYVALEAQNYSMASYFKETNALTKPAQSSSQLPL